MKNNPIKQTQFTPVKKEVSKVEASFSYEKLAYAVAMAETKNCELGYGKMYNNCFGIKSGNTAPCKEIGTNKMCIYENPEDSYEAFMKIWSTHYKVFPNIRLASIWTGNDKPYNWLNNVNYYYN